MVSSSLLSLVEEEEDDLRLFLGPEADLGTDGCRFVMGRLFLTGLGGANKEQRFPMKKLEREKQSKKGLGFMEFLEREREREREREKVGVQVKVVARSWQLLNSLLIVCNGESREGPC